ncbi:MAG TPA: CAP domain-containing protein [Bacillales bacterium]
MSRLREGRILGKISRTFIPIGIIVLLVVFFFDFREEPAVPDNSAASPQKQNIPKEDKDRPVPTTKKSLDSLIGLSAKQVKSKFGGPAGIDPSAYGYDWWIYNQDEQHYMQIGVEDGEVVTVFAFGRKLNTKPFIIGKKKEGFLKKVPFKSTISLKVNGGSYQFELSEKELNVRPLISVDGVSAILYFDSFTGKLAGIRYVNAETLVKLRPYALSYRGVLISAGKLSRREWESIESGEEQHILDMTNIIRRRFGLPPLKGNKEVAKVAFQHSKEMAVKDYFSHTSPTAGGLGDRFHDANIAYQQAGENIAAHYTDGISAVFGWLNSKGHRKNLLHKAYTGLGVGVYKKYYTQDFIKPF